MIQQAETWFLVTKILHKPELPAEQTLLFRYSQRPTRSTPYLSQLP